MLKRACGNWLRYRCPHCRCLKWFLFLAFSPAEVFCRHCNRKISLLGSRYGKLALHGHWERQRVACLACEHWKREGFAHSWGKASPQSLGRDGEWGRTALKMLIMISDSDTISSLVRCPFCVYHCLDHCQDLLFRCWVSLWTQLSFLYNSSFLYLRRKPCSFSNPAILL